jgi:hypothetical protein
MHMLMYRCALAAVAEVHACVCRCARAVSVVRVVCVRARAIAGAVERGAHLSARRMGMCVPVKICFGGGLRLPPNVIPRCFVFTRYPIT